MKIPLFACLALSLVFSGTASADALSDSEQKMISEALGSGVVGEKVDAPTVSHADEWFPLRPATWTYRVTSGTNAGQDIEAKLTAQTSQGAPRGSWRFGVGADHAQFLNANDTGIFRVAGQNHQQGVLTRYHPPQPVFPNGLKPGDVKKDTIAVKVYDLSDTHDVTHTGSLDVVMTYVGAFRVNVPAGEFDAVLLRSIYKGKVGPANVSDKQYLFFAKGVGIVASIQHENVSAFLLYNEDSTTGRVLAKGPVGIKD